ncbi:MAG: FtsX-like permease family protein, partial [Erysipelotrichaceae bacterium]|nr:FtsX-like permease family protein [Erysipelotrichaceae bacterium]
FAMAYFILLNLVNMFINQKKRELTVMRVNGFTVKEVKNYVGKELIVNTAIGILLGLPLGGIMAYRIILLLENINCFDRSIYYPGGLIAAVVTAIFSFFISQSALRKVKDLKLTDV